MKQTSDIYLAGSVRTPIGSFAGALSAVSAPVLGSTTIGAAIERAAIDRKEVDEVIFGNVLGAGLGQNVARQCAIGAGLDNGVGACTVNKVCGSSLKAVMLAAQAIKCGDAAVVVAGGTENMSAAPYLLPKARAGYRMGNGVLVDAMINDGLWDVYNDAHMGTYGDRCAEKYSFTREEQDSFAIESYKRAINSIKEGIFASEIVPIEIKSKKGVVRVDSDEEPQRFNEEKFRKLSPAFGANGTVTAGNASSINDGAAAVIAFSSSKVDELGVKPEAKILGYATFSCEPEWFTTAPVGAISKLMRDLKLKVDDVDLFEINEAFSVVPMAAMREIGIPRKKVNVLGGAVALGHPIGASGARTLVTLLNAMKRNGATIGINALCIGGGEAVAMAVERC
jgi:acetyl-CoA C-acetyltransferase